MYILFLLINQMNKERENWFLKIGGSLSFILFENFYFA